MDNITRMATDKLTEEAKEVDIEVDSDQATEKERERLKHQLASSINESSNVIFSLVNKLAHTKDEGRKAVIADMIVDEYVAARAMVGEYKRIGGEYYSIDRGLWRYVMGY